MLNPIKYIWYRSVSSLWTCTEQTQCCCIPEHMQNVCMSNKELSAVFCTIIWKGDTKTKQRKPPAIWCCCLGTKAKLNPLWMHNPNPRKFLKVPSKWLGARDTEEPGQMWGWVEDFRVRQCCDQDKGKCRCHLRHFSDTPSDGLSKHDKSSFFLLCYWRLWWQYLKHQSLCTTCPVLSCLLPHCSQSCRKPPAVRAEQRPITLRLQIANESQVFWVKKCYLSKLVTLEIPTPES